jgi:hypothetical protein
MNRLARERIHETAEEHPEIEGHWEKRGMDGKDNRFDYEA